MGGSRRRHRKFRTSKVKVGVVKKKKTEKATIPRELLQEHTKSEELLGPSSWDKETTLTANYRANKFVMDPNEGFGRNKTGPQLKSKEEREAAGEETHDDDDEQRAACNLPRHSGKAPPPRLTATQIKLVEKLMAAHGEDYEAMQKDRKLNPMQHSAGKIKALVGAYRGTDTALTRHDFRAPFKPYKRL